MKNPKPKKWHYKRYRLHQKIRKEGYRLLSRERTILLAHDEAYLTTNAKRLLNEFKYSIQIEIT